MLPRSFYFLRHGETDWNREGRIQGHTDIPLNDTGRAQAEQVVAVLARTPINRIVCSSLSRAYETASIINAALQKPLLVDDGLKERHFGAFEGLSLQQMDDLRLAQKGPVEENGYPCPPEGEPYASFRQRSIASFSKNLEQFEGENILFVSHGGVYRVLRRCLFTDLDHSGNVQPFHFEKGDRTWNLVNLR